MIDSLWGFDVGLMLGNNLDLDVNNAYYVYIMAALYFAVPAVTGQCVLGAKAGAAGLVTGAFQQQAADAGRGASSGKVGADAQHIGQVSSGAQMGMQEAALRGSGFGAGAIAAGNTGLSESDTAGQLNARNTARQGMQSNLGAAAATAQSIITAGSTTLREGPNVITGGGAKGAQGAVNRWGAGVSVLAANAARDVTSTTGGKTAAIQADIAKDNISAGKHSMASQFAGAGQNRMQEAGQYDARMASRRAQLAVGDRVSGENAAMGQFASAMGADAVTSMPMGAAMRGMLGQGAASNAWAGVSGADTSGMKGPFAGSSGGLAASSDAGFGKAQAMASDSKTGVQASYTNNANNIAPTLLGAGKGGSTGSVDDAASGAQKGASGAGYKEPPPT